MEQQEGQSVQRIPSQIQSKKSVSQRGLILPLTINAGENNMQNEILSSRRSSSQRVNPPNGIQNAKPLESVQSRSTREFQLPSSSRSIQVKALVQNKNRSYSSARENQKRILSQREHEHVELTQERAEQMIESRKVVESLRQRMSHFITIEGDLGDGFEEAGQRRKEKAEKIKKDLEDPMEGSKLEEYFQHYEVMVKDNISKESLLSSPNLRIKQYKKSIYFGEVQNGTKTGKGIMIYNNGRVFEGEWQNDVKFGMGYELYPNGNAFLGFYVNGKPEGSGTYLWSNGEVYDGEWVNGMKHGNGQWMGIKGDSYTGEWKFGKPDGHGIHRWLNGDIYNGEFKSCLKHGQGKEYFENGDVYIGQYSNGRPEGLGQYLWSDGAEYEGLFKNGLRHGQGKWRNRREGEVGDSYEGEYLNDKRCGQGVFRWASGNVYKGQYFDDMRHGYGEIYWTDSSYYKGDWERGIQSGQGELYSVGQGVRRGIFKNNVFKELGDIKNNSGNGSIHGSSRSNSKLFRSISEEMATPRGIQQGQSGKRYFMPQTPDLSEEGSVMLTSNRSKNNLIRNNSSYGKIISGKEEETKDFNPEKLNTPNEDNMILNGSNVAPDGDYDIANSASNNNNYNNNNNIEAQQFNEQEQQQQPAPVSDFDSNLPSVNNQPRKSLFPTDNNQPRKSLLPVDNSQPRKSSLPADNVTQQQRKSLLPIDNVQPRKSLLPTDNSNQPRKSLVPADNSNQPRRSLLPVESSTINNNKNKKRNSIASNSSGQNTKRNSVSSTANMKQKLSSLLQQNDAETTKKSNNYYSYGYTDEATQTAQDEGTQSIQDQEYSLNSSFQNGGNSLSGGDSSSRETGNGKIRRSVSLQQNQVKTSGIKSNSIAPQRQQRAISLMPNENQQKYQNQQQTNSIQQQQRQVQQYPLQLPVLVQQINQKPLRRSSPRKNKVILLRKDEIILWKIKKQKLLLKPKDLRDFTDQKTVDIIRNLLHPPLWKPSGVQHSLQQSPRQTVIQYSPSRNYGTGSKSPQQSPRLK